MTTRDPKVTIELLEIVRRDIEDDVKALEGKPFTGRVVSEHLGYLAAQVDAIAGALIGMLSVRVDEGRCSLCGDPLTDPAGCLDRHSWEDHGTCCVGACQTCRGHVIES